MPKGLIKFNLPNPPSNSQYPLSQPAAATFPLLITMSYTPAVVSDLEFATIDPLPSYPQIILNLDFLRDEPLAFHWHLFVPYESQVASLIQKGCKLHATEDYGTGAKVWQFDSREFTLATSTSITTAAVIGRLPAQPGHALSDLITLLSGIKIDVVPNVDKDREPRFSCRVYGLGARSLGSYARQRIHPMS